MKISSMSLSSSEGKLFHIPIEQNGHGKKESLFNLFSEKEKGEEESERKKNWNAKAFLNGEFLSGGKWQDHDENKKQRIAHFLINEKIPFTQFSSWYLSCLLHASSCLATCHSIYF